VVGRGETDERVTRQESPASRFDAIVFDLDGVIVDTEQALYAVWREVFTEFGCSFERDEWQALVGRSGEPGPYEWLARRSPLPLPALDELRATISARELLQVEQLGPLPGVVAWIDAARRRGLGLAVASSSSRRWVEARLDGVGLLARFDAVICRDAQLRSKPEPDVYQAACRALEVESSRAVAIEDSHNGVLAAVAAGLRCIAVPHDLTADMDFTAADFVVPSLDALDLDAALQRLAAPTDRPWRLCGRDIRSDGSS
jgi:HAD superfamily hydrolase (TIGR01509 family)